VFVPSEPKKWLAYAFGPRDPLTPPPWLHNIGGGDSRAISREFLGHFIELGGLTPSDRVLDIGSGTGRMALALTEYLETGTYYGLEIVKSSVDWCRRAYAPFRNFTFVHADLGNNWYNRRGSQDAESYRLPFDDHSFDFIFLTSVFTHMRPQEVRNYLREIARVLAPNGKALVTAYLLNRPAHDQIHNGAAHFSFKRRGHGFFHEYRSPERAIAYDQSEFLQMVAGAGLTAAVFPGSWTGLPGRSWQDILVIGHQERA
jgi:ubiquinone/menaquinone biosynthesis C-methylase UbiE